MYFALKSYQGFLMISLVPKCPLFSGMCSFSLGGGLGSVLCYPDTTALVGALAFLEGVPPTAMRVFTNVQPGLEPKHSSVEVNLSRDAGM